MWTFDKDASITGWRLTTEQKFKGMTMKKIINKVLKKHGNSNLESNAARVIIADEIVEMIRTTKGWYLNLDTKDKENKK